MANKEQKLFGTKVGETIGHLLGEASGQISLTYRVGKTEFNLTREESKAACQKDYEKWEAHRYVVHAQRMHELK
jgi:hypothetical protein